MALTGKISAEVMRQASEQTVQLNALEASHVYAIIKQTLDKLALVGVITVDPKVQAAELTQSVGEEITRMIAEQKKLETRFEELVALQHVLRHQPNKNKLVENQTELQKVADQLRQSTKQLCRNLKDNPNVAENMLKVASERQALQLLLNNCLNELEVYGKAQPVVESVMAQEAQEVQMRETIEHERLTTAAVRQLRTDLREEKLEHEDKMKEKKKTVTVLKDQLKSMKMDTAVTIRYTNNERGAGNEHERRLQRTQLEDMVKELALVQQQIEIERAVHATTAEFLKKLGGRLQDDKSRWNQQHEEDMAARERELDQLRAQTARDTAELRKLEEKHKQETELKAEREQRELEARDAEAMEGQRQLRILQAVLTIQAYYRGWKVRTGGSSGKKGKKGGKGGAKKKK